MAGSSNSQDSFPAPGASNASSMDGYNNYPPGPGGYPAPPPPANASGDYAGAPNMPRPPSQTNPQNPHPGAYLEGGVPVPNYSLVPSVHVAWLSVAKTLERTLLGCAGRVL